MKFFKNKNPEKKGDSRLKEFRFNDKYSVIFNSHGLVPVVIQHSVTGEVLKLGYLDKWALEMSFGAKKVYLFRRSRQRLQEMGEDEDQEYKITEILLSETKRDLLFKVLPTKSNKLHKEYTIKIHLNSE